MARPEIKTWQNLEAAFAGESMIRPGRRGYNEQNCFAEKLASAAGVN